MKGTVTVKLTKLEHSGMILEQNGAKLIVDPGKFTTPITESAGTVAVIVTHVHDDHWTPEQLARIAERNTRVRVFTPADAVEAIAASPAGDVLEVTAVGAGDEVAVGPFALRFYGGMHAEIHPSLPRVENVGFVVNDVFAYGGDSFDVPLTADGEPLAVDTLAVPAHGPWMKLAEAIDLVDAVRPNRVFAAHEMHLAMAGKTLVTRLLTQTVEGLGGSYLDLQPYDTAEIDE